MKNYLLGFLIGISGYLSAQTYPTFGPEIDVTINGLTFDAMEPFISNDGNYLFFNSLNNGIDTKIYYATKVDDSTFTFVGELNGTNQTVQPHLDAVPDMDENGYFLWTSTRDYPSIMENLHHGDFSAGNVTNIGRVYGDFNIYSPGWLIMDHGISVDGQYLYANNAYFDTCQGPCATWFQIAEKVNDTLFNVIANSDGILQYINDSVNYIYYASCITSDDLELYFTRFPRGPVTISTSIDIVVAVRDTPTDTFSLPQVLFSSNPTNIVEAPTLTNDKSIMYYHKKVGSTHEIKMRYRTSWANQTNSELGNFNIYPNPASNYVRVIFKEFPKPGNGIRIRSINGKIIQNESKISNFWVDFYIEHIPSGLYILELYQNEKVVDSKKFIKQ